MSHNDSYGNTNQYPGYDADNSSNSYSHTQEDMSCYDNIDSHSFFHIEGTSYANTDNTDSYYEIDNPNYFDMETPSFQTEDASSATRYVNSTTAMPSNPSPLPTASSRGSQKSSSRSGQSSSWSRSAYPPTAMSDHRPTQSSSMSPPARPASRTSSSSSYSRSSSSRSSSSRTSHSSHKSPSMPPPLAEDAARSSSRRSSRDAFNETFRSFQKPLGPEHSTRHDTSGSRYRLCAGCGIVRLRSSKRTVCAQCEMESSRDTGPLAATSAGVATPAQPPPLASSLLASESKSESSHSRTGPYPSPAFYSATPVLGGSGLAPAGRYCRCGRKKHSVMALLCDRCHDQFLHGF